MVLDIEKVGNVRGMTLFFEFDDTLILGDFDTSWIFLLIVVGNWAWELEKKKETCLKRVRKFALTILP